MLPLAEEIYLRNQLNDYGVSEGSVGLNFTIDIFSGTGAQTVFNLAHLPSTLYPAFISINGVLQSSGYTLVGQVLTFTVAPGNGITCTARYQY